MQTFNPVSAWLTVNRKCNFRCAWCYAKGTKYNSKNDMTLPLAKSLTQILIDARVQNLLIIGGEPTLWKPLIQFNNFCSQQKICSILVTNGLYFSNDNFWENYQQHPNTVVGLSLKACSPQQLKTVAQVRNFKAMRKGICRAIQKLRANVSITYNTFYINNLVDIVQFAVDCGATSVKIDFCSTTFVDNQPDTKYMVPPQELARNIMRDYPRLESVTNGHVIFEMMVPFCLWPPEFIEQLRNKKQLLSVCHVHKRSGLIFDSVGNLIMCNALFDYPIGKYGQDFNDGISLLNWINTPKIANYYKRIGSYPSEVCRSCLWYNDCGGGCPLRWAAYKPADIIRPYIGSGRKEVAHGTAL